MSNGRTNWERLAEIYTEQGKRWAEAQEEAKTKIREKGGLLANIWESITDFFSAAFTNVWSGFHGFFGPLFGKAENWFDSWNVGAQVEKNPDWWKPVFKRFGFDDNDIQAIEALMPGLPGEGLVLPFFVFATAIMKLIGNVSTVASGSAYKRLMSQFTPSTPSAGEVLRASFVAPELHSEVLRVLRENGLSDEDIKMLFVANYALQNEQQIREIYHRAGKDEGWIKNRLREHGFTDERIEEIKETLEVIPGIQDLVFFMGREAFEPDMIARYGLDELYPGELTQWAAKHGLNEFWARKYWLAHWNHPELRTVFELFHRDQIDTEEMWNYFGLVEIPPFWREKLINISYNVITRVDARRMWQLGVITDETQLFDLYRHMGYSPNDAELMTEWTKTYASESERDLTRSDIVQAYIDRDLSATEAVTLLKRIGYPETYADFIVYRTEMDLQRSQRDEKLKLIKDRFVNRLISETDARNQAIGIGFATERVNELINDWKFLIAKSTAIPSKTDLDKFLKNKIISEDKYVETMDKLGYSIRYINWYLKLIYKGMEE